MSRTRFLAGLFALASVITWHTPAGLAAQRPGATRRAAAPETRGAITPRQRERLAARIAIATGLVNRFEQEAKALGRSAGWRRATLDALLGLSLDQIERVERDAHGADALTAALTAAATEGPEVFGDRERDVVYFPITPCRFADTRNIGGPINGFRGYDLFNNGATYGGDASCDPTTRFGIFNNNVAALALNVTIVGPTSAPGFAAVKPNVAAPTTSLLNWYEAGPTVQVANQGLVTMDHSFAPEEFYMQTSGSVHVILDIFGAFLPPHATALQAVTQETTSVIANGGAFDVETACPAGYSVTDGGHIWGGAATGLWLQSSFHSAGNSWRCRGSNQSGAPQSFTCVARCARVPGR